MESEYHLFWTNEAIHNLESILNYLNTNWSQRKMDIFKMKLGRFLDLLISNPKLFPKSEYNDTLRKAVLSKQITIFYKVSGTTIYLAYLFNQKQSSQKIKTKINLR